MPPEVTAQAVHERSLADCEAYYNALGTLSAAQERRREVERELRANCAAQGCGVPAANDSTIAEIRSGQWERRTKLSMQTLLHNRARLARLKREGFTFDREHRLVAPALTRIHVPERRENRERRPAPRRRVASSASSEDPLPEPDPPLRVVPPAEFRRLVHALESA